VSERRGACARRAHCLLRLLCAAATDRVRWQHLLDLREHPRTGLARAAALVDAGLLKNALSAFLARIRARCDDAELLARMERACARL